MQKLIIGVIVCTTVGCSTSSIVVSTKAKPDHIEQGIIYSLPKQLVKVEYSRKRLDSGEAAVAREKAKEKVSATQKLLDAKVAEEKATSALIANIDPTATNKAELEAKLQLELTKIKAEKLGLTITLKTQTDQLSTAETDYALALQSDDAFTEKLSITAADPIPDTANTFYATIDHDSKNSDAVDLSVKNGLLHGAIGHSEDMTGEIIVSLAGAFSGLNSLSGIRLRSLTGNYPKQTPCPTKKSVISFEQIIDPDNPNDQKIVNDRLSSACLRLEINPAMDYTKASIDKNNLTKDGAINGIMYRQPGTYTFNLIDTKSNSKIQTIKLNLAQGGQIGYLSMPKGRLSKTEYDIAFSSGILTKSKIVQPSEYAAAAMIIPNALKAIFAIPTELIQFKVDYSTSEKDLMALKKTMLETQLEIDKKQMELDSLAASE